LQRLGSLLQRKKPEAPAPAAAPAPPPAAAPAAEPPSATAAMADPIVAGVTQELASEQAQPVPTEDEQLQAEQHTAWAAYDFERCIVIFSRLLELHPGDANYKEKLVASYFNRGKQYEAEGNEERATQLYYSALALDPEFGPAQEAAQALLAKNES
jgi:tetratricopeptide (TPR) repeat protein